MDSEKVWVTSENEDEKQSSGYHPNQEVWQRTFSSPVYIKPVLSDGVAAGDGTTCLIKQ